ncbi:tetratricopeptide repeat protein [Halomonas sp. CUBES01]|uniref:protein O-GlcNAc transferase n=1 Tax=Vreelandella gomseomensis TaxID=370766 RepID=A0ABU1GFD7_9GAMM|nr:MULTISPECIES: tetratricopeptide repeat protein [Halomonas]MDR5876198.1 tetratricopeptide repeat protein [Halomonas gomseomensis]MEC4768508.1 tetratricopeptide repeat protein [Halomonas sp. CUBES01]
MSKQAAKRFEKQIKEAQKLVAKQPQSARYRRSLGVLLTDKGELEKAKVELEKAISLESSDFESYSVLGKVLYNLGDYNAAIDCLKKSLSIKPGFHKSAHYLAYLLYNSNKPKEALEYIEEACKNQPRNAGYLISYGNILEALHRYEEAAEKFKKSLELESDKYYAWNNLGNIYKQLGRMEDALRYYDQAFKVNPGSDIAYSNKITTLHYIPGFSLEEIAKECRAWDSYFNKKTPVRAEPSNKDVEKKLRIGMISDGFRRHPVGYMITSAIEKLVSYNYELYFYSTNYDYDALTTRLQKTAAKWQEIKPLGVEQTEQLIREDEIDILIDLAGHNSGNRMLAIAKEPAPIIMKWVGGLINTTGVKAIDYLISDHIETPEGIDQHYVENLIRLPGDYVCYELPGYEPDVRVLPALKNGYITFGCFNNPTKINPEIVAVWSEILLSVPNSHMFLKGMQFSSDDLKKRVIKLFEECGVPEERLIIEGPSAHQQLLESYNRVDIALDPWPYSGGLTTCEALLMGVPVITMPGPTFAGRHSASHLVNAGLAELVVGTWEEYRQRAVGLASDLESLGTIRKGLRQQLLDSPVCNARSFAKHLNTALRAAWQRYCEGNAPAALSFDQSGQAYFEGDSRPVEVACAEPILQHEQEGFSWELAGKVIVIDNGSKLIRQNRFNRLRQVQAFGFVGFDPGSRIDNPAQFDGSEDVQVFSHASLGDGQPATLYACLDPTLSSTLKPMSSEHQREANLNRTMVLAQLPINTITLDSIDGLSSLDWLILDELSDAATILENGKNALKDTLLIQVSVAFQPTHERQPSLAELQHWASRNGFRFYRFNNEQHASYLPETVPEEKRQATELQSADVLFLPSHERMAELTDNQRIKLAFLLHTVYGIRDMAYLLLAKVDEEKAKKYLIEEKLLSVETPQANVERQHQLPKRKIFLVGFPKSGTSTIQKALEETGYTSAHWKVKEGFVGQLMYQGLQDHDDPWHYLQGYDAITQGDVCIPARDLNYWPNLDFETIAKIQEKHPDCLFILNYRDPEKIVSSIERWGDLLDRLKVSYVPGLYFSEGDDAENLRVWIESHFDKVRDYFEGSENFIEVDINNEDAPNKIGQKLGVQLAWWGVANENKQKQTSFSLPKAPHMSPAERKLFKKSLKKADKYFEFGSGGSTVWAVDQGLTVKGVESDATWVTALKDKLGGKCQVDAVDIGPTKEWGFPVTLEDSEKFPAYSKAIHSHKQSFDLILIDGRFRVACTMAAIQHVLEYSEDPQETRIFIHDFWNRPHYHVVLACLETVEKVESAGLFRVAKNVDRNKVAALWEQYAKSPQ